MLKEQEQFEFVRGEPSLDPRSTNASYSEMESVLERDLNNNASMLIALHRELELLEGGETSAEKEQAWYRIRDRISNESQRFDDLLKRIEVSLHSEKIDGSPSLLGITSGLGAVQAQLDALSTRHSTSAAVVYFLPGERSTYFLVTTKSGSFAVQGGLGQRELDELILEFRNDIKHRDSKYKGAATKLYKGLIRPIEGRLRETGVKTLMLYLVDSMRYMPFAALFDEDEKVFLCEKYELALFTAATHADLSRNPKDHWVGAALGVSVQKQGFDPLPYVKQELIGVVRDRTDGEPRGVMEGVRYLNDDFTRQRILRLLEGMQGYGVLHIATHFQLAPGKEEDSFLLTGDGYPLTLRELRTDQGIRLSQYDLITLSACDTAVGTKGRGAEVEGLGYVIQKKGASSVLATLWKVQDIGTMHFMGEFYKRRGENRKMSKWQALMKTQVAFIHGNVVSDNPKLDLTHPYYWAPFVLMGNGL